MSGKTNIEWTDATWNPVRGCMKISPGCKHCYAETFAERFRGVKGHPYERGFDPRTVPPAAVRFLSCEPLLGPVDLHYVALPEHIGAGSRGIDWIIVGGESGPGARPFDTRWARSIVQQCKAAGVPVFVKQMGANPITNTFLGSTTEPLMLLDRKGGKPEEWLPDLRVREWPEVRG